MTLDLVLLAFFSLLVFLGWRSGFTGQVLRVVAAGCVVVGTSPVSTLGRQALFEHRGIVSNPLIEVASMVAAALAIYIVVSVAGWLVIKAMHMTSDTLSMTDHASGALVGALKAGLIVYICGVFVLLLFGPFQRVDPTDRLHLRDGRVTAFIEKHDIIAPWRFPDVDRLERAIRVASHAKDSRRVREMLRDDADAADFVRLDAFEVLLDLPSLVEAARQGRLPLVLASEEARAFLNDSGYVDELRRVDWEALEQKIGIAPIDSPPETAKEKEKEGGLSVSTTREE